MSKSIQSVVVVHFDEDGEQAYHVFGGAEVRLFVVDERAPGDRVYEITGRSEPAKLPELIPAGCDIGHSGDERHAAIAHRIEAYRNGVKPLTVVE